MNYSVNSPISRIKCLFTNLFDNNSFKCITYLFDDSLQIFSLNYDEHFMRLELLNNPLLFQYNYPNYYNSILNKSNIELFKNKSLTPSCEYFIF